MALEMQQRRQAILDECARRDITITQRGQGYLLTGVGVRMLCADIGYLNENDLTPYTPRQPDEQRAF